MFRSAMMFRSAANRAAPAVRALHTTAPKRAIYDNILQTIGKTPIVEVKKLAPAGVRVFAKCEYFNPLGSVKDRLALAVIEDAEQSGELRPGMTVVEPTSGNTGIALAMVCAQKGYKCVLVMAESFSVERRKIMRGMGAQVVLTPAAGKGTGMVNKAKALAAEHGWFMPCQFENPANAEFHFKTTGPEIIDDFKGLGLDYFVSGYGTGGTLQGTAKALRIGSPDTKIVVTEPTNAALLGSGVDQERHSDGTPSVSHEAFSPHPIQGWTPDFIPLLAEQAQASNYIDELLPVEGPESVAMAQRLAREEGIFCGISGGGTMACALKIAAKAPEGSTILAMIPDTAERYMTTPLFADIEADMDEEEAAIYASTPN